MSEGAFRYHLNTDSCYFNNFLNVSAAWDDAFGEVKTPELVRQQLKNNSFSANSITHWIRLGQNGKGVEILSKNAFRTQPQRLTITPGLYPDRFNNGDCYAAHTQNVRYNALASNNRLSFLSAVVLGDIKIDPAANINVEHQTLHSDLGISAANGSSQPITDTEMQNNIAWTRINAGISIDGSYTGERLKLNWMLPIIYRYTVIDNLLKNDEKQIKGKFYFQSSLSAKYNLTPQFEANASAEFHTQTPGLSTIYTGYILQNYRSINRYDTKLFDSHGLFTSLSLSHKNILSMFLRVAA
ncbi:MAG: hypothetical protein LBD28_07990 [Tannerellaceae bacterium]|nr:hypothetical protein [Tannerellaceae bacterium]